MILCMVCRWVEREGVVCRGVQVWVEMWWEGGGGEGGGGSGEGEMDIVTNGSVIFATD